MDFRPNCKSCLYLSMVLQRPVACEQHVSSSAWSAAAEAFSPPGLEPPTSRPAGPDPLGSVSPELLTPERPAPFSGVELARLSALRCRVREQMLRGCSPDDLPAPRGQPDSPDAPRS